MLDEVEKKPGPCQMPGLYADVDPRTRKGEWERWSCVAEVFESTGLGILARHQVYISIIWSNIDDLQMKRRKDGWGLRTDIVEEQK